MDIEFEHAHIAKFIDGFESIMKQYKYKHFVEVGGVETYTVGVMRAEGLTPDLICGTENFITEGLAKLWEMVSGFVKNVTNYFFGGERKAAKAKETATETIKDVSETKKALSDTPANPVPTPAPKPQTASVPQKPSQGDSMAAAYARIERINNHARALAKHLNDSGKVWFTGINPADTAKEIRALATGTIPSNVTSKLNDLAKEVDKFSDIAKHHEKLNDRIITYKVPEGNRLDKSALNAILDMTTEYSKSVKEVIDSSKRCIDLASDIVALLKKLPGSDEKEIAHILRDIQNESKVIAIRLKNYTGLVEKVNTEVNKIKDLL